MNPANSSSGDAQQPEAPFGEPWQARIFALMVELNAKGHFAWAEFQTELARRIATDESAGIDRDYYERWLLAAEALLVAKGLVHNDVRTAT